VRDRGVRPLNAPLSSRLDHLTAWSYRAGWWIVRHAPEPVVSATLMRLADRTWSRRGRAVVQLERNLAHARPQASVDELRELSRAAMRSYLRYWGEVFRLPRWSGDDLLRILVEHPATADRLAWRLCDTLLGERAVDAGAVAALAADLRRHNLDVGRAVAVVLRSRAFFAEEDGLGKTP